MRNLGIISFIITSLTCSAQDGVPFKSYFKPNMIYKTTITTSSKSEVNFSGNQEIIDKMKASGTNIPMIMSVSSEMITTTTTGEYSADMSFPAKIVYGKTTATQKLHDQETRRDQPFSGLIIMGFYNKENKLEIDTMISETMDKTAMKIFRSTLDVGLQQIKFPETPLKVGESFEQKLPMKIPIVGYGAAGVVIVTNYKLVEINGSIAIFDVLSKVTMDVANDTPGISATGEGFGVSEFDMVSNTITWDESELTMIMKMNVNGLVVSAKTITKSKQLVKVEEAESRSKEPD